MQKKISKKVDYVLEAFYLFSSLLADEEPLAEREKSLLAKYTDYTDEIKRIYRLLNKIQKEAAKTFQKQREEISFYFGCQDKNEEETNVTLASFLLLTDYAIDFRGKSLKEIERELKQYPEEKYCRKFGEALQHYGCTILDTACEKDITPADVTRRILKMDLPDETKVHLQEMFWNKEEHREKLFTLLEKGIDFLHRFDTDFQAEIEIFYRYWKEKLKKQDFSDFIQNDWQINIEPNELGYEIWVSIIETGIKSYARQLNDDGTCDTPDIVYMGTLFSAGISLLHGNGKSEKEMAVYTADVLKALSDPSKFEILSYIRDKSAYGSELAKHMGLTTATISHHMNSLLVCGLVKLEKENNRIFYQENKEAVEEVLDYCKRVLL